MKMVSRLLFEDDMDETVNKGNKLKEESPTDGDICSQIQRNDSPDVIDINSSTADTMDICSNKDSIISQNVIILGSRKTISNEQEDNISQDDDNISQDEGNTSQDEGNSSQDEGNTSPEEANNFQDEGNVTILGEGKPKGKRRIKSELEWLLLDVKKKDEGSDGEFDVFGDESKIFRKYKLRKTEQTISYKEPADIKLKRRSINDETDLTCPVCQQELENKVALIDHLRAHNKFRRGYSCSLCSKKFDRNPDLMAHRQTHNGESFLCQECKLAFSSYCDYLLHNYEHLNQSHFQCLECGMRYRKSVYKQHVMTHFEKQLSCNLCSFVTNSKHKLQTHSNQHNNKLICVECGKVLNSKTHLEYHLSVHTGVKKVQCLYCGACFRSKSARDIHTRTHTGEKPYTCEICGHKNRQWTDYVRHKETHTEKKFECDICGKKYLHKYYLVIHMRSHTKKSLYECPECGAGFVSTGGLRTHTMFKHTSERPVECAVCDKRFISYNQYRKHCRAKYHLRNVYGNKMSTELKD